MQIKLVSQPDAVIARWQELVDDPELARWPGKVETDRLGRTIMSPPPAFGHVSYVAKIIRLWNRLLPEGQANADTPPLKVWSLRQTRSGSLLTFFIIDELTYRHFGSACRALIKTNKSSVERRYQ
jgi:hypothetical protein